MKLYVRSSIEPNKALAMNSKDPEELARLANDEDYHVRAYVARNKNTPADILA